MWKAVPGAAVNRNCTLIPVMDAVRYGGNTTIGLGCQELPDPETVYRVVSVLPPELTRPVTVRLPVPDTRRTKNRSDGVEEFTHIHGLRAVAPPGSSTECVPVAPSSGLESTATVFAPLPHDQPLAPFSKVEP